jgi:hypothetical protein
MSKNRDLLKEAIADAKAVKETAIANAKAALEEAFTPHLKSMLAAKLEEMDKEDVDEGYDKYEEDDVNEEMDSKKKADKEKMDEEMKEDDKVDEAKKEEIDEEITLDELLAELNETEVEENKRTDAEQEGYKDGFEDAKDDIEKELKSMKVSESENSETELSENARTDAEEEGYKDGLKDEKEDMKEDARTDAEEEGYKDGMKDEKEDMNDEEIDLEDMSEDDLKGFIEDVIKDMVGSGELEAGEEFESEEVDGDVEIDSEEEIEVEDEVEIPMMEEKEELEEMDAVSWNDKNNPTRGASKVDLDPKKVGKSTAAYSINEEEVTKMLAEVEELKKELTEVNLLNAKLLYTNKIFKSKNLNEAKKVKVLKAFDKASTVKEAKVIFETLNEGMSSKMTKPSINEVKGSASKASGISPKAKQPIVENAAFMRMQQLAGIIKKEN